MYTHYYDIEYAKAHGYPLSNDIYIVNIGELFA